MLIFLIITFILLLFADYKFNPHLYFIKSENMFVLWYNYNKERKRLIWKM